MEKLVKGATKIKVRLVKLRLQTRLMLFRSWLRPSRNTLNPSCLPRMGERPASPKSSGLCRFV